MCELHAWRSSGRRNQHVFSTCYVSGDDYVLFLNPPSNGWSWRAGSCTSMESTMFGSKTSSWLEPQPCHSWAVSLGQSYNGSLFPGFFLCELMTLKAPTEGGWRDWLPTQKALKIALGPGKPSASVSCITMISLTLRVMLREVKGLAQGRPARKQLIILLPCPAKKLGRFTDMWPVQSHRDPHSEGSTFLLLSLNF